jgi:phosphate transport system protein
MGVHAGEMVKKSIQAFISKDRTLADQVCALDEEIDVMHRSIFKRVTMLMKSPDSPVDELIAALSISRYIERMADHATMIAREVIYLVTGEIVRHRGDFYEDLLASLEE